MEQNVQFNNVIWFFVKSIVLPTEFRLNIIENFKFNSFKSINFILDEKVLVTPKLYVLGVSSKHVDIKVSSS